MLGAGGLHFNDQVSHSGMIAPAVSVRAALEQHLHSKFQQLTAAMPVPPFCRRVVNGEEALRILWQLGRGLFSDGLHFSNQHLRNSPILSR